MGLQLCTAAGKKITVTTSSGSSAAGRRRYKLAINPEDMEGYSHDKALATPSSGSCPFWGVCASCTCFGLADLCGQREESPPELVVKALNGAYARPNHTISSPMGLQPCTAAGKKRTGTTSSGISAAGRQTYQLAINLEGMEGYSHDNASATTSSGSCAGGRHRYHSASNLEDMEGDSDESDDIALRTMEPATSLALERDSEDSDDIASRTVELATSLAWNSPDGRIANFLSSRTSLDESGWCHLDHANLWRIADLIPDGAEGAIPISRSALARALLALSPVSNIHIKLIGVPEPCPRWMGLMACLRSNPKLRRLMVDIHWLRPNITDDGVLGRSLGRMLHDNPTLESLEIVYDMKRETATGMAHSVKLNQRLHTLHLKLKHTYDGTLEAVCSMACNLSALTDFQLICAGFEPTSVDAADGVACVLRQTRTLKEFVFCGNWLPEARKRMLSALSETTIILEGLYLDFRDAADAEALVKLLTPQQAAGPGTGGAGGGGILASLKYLHFWPPAPAKAVADMIRHNRTLRTLGHQAHSNSGFSSLSLCRCPRVRYTAEEWAWTVMPALEQNTSLRHLSFENCHGLDDDDDEVYQSLIRMLKVNSTLESIKHMPWGWQRQMKETGFKLVDLLQRNKAYNTVVAGLPTMHWHRTFGEWCEDICSGEENNGDAKSLTDYHTMAGGRY